MILMLKLIPTDVLTPTSLLHTLGSFIRQAGGGVFLTKQKKYIDLNSVVSGHNDPDNCIYHVGGMGF